MSKTLRNLVIKKKLLLYLPAHECVLEKFNFVVTLHLLHSAFLHLLVLNKLTKHMTAIHTHVLQAKGGVTRMAQKKIVSRPQQASFFKKKNPNKKPLRLKYTYRVLSEQVLCSQDRIKLNAIKK